MFSQSHRALLEYAQILGDLSATIAILAWDQETHLPENAGSARAQQLATLSGVLHEKIIDPKFKKLLAQAKPKNAYDQALVRELQRLYDHAAKLPEKLVKDYAEATSTALESWKKARQNNNFAEFAPDLQKVLDLRIAIAKKLKKPGQTLYDVMLDDFEFGLTEKEVSAVFSKLKPELIKLTDKYAKLTKNADQSLLKIDFPESGQWDLGVFLAQEIGYDLSRGRQDKSTHPFTTTFSVHDVRITTRFDHDLRSSLFATIHETGHALYEQGVDPQLDRLQIGETGGLGGGTGMAMHESQSRLWENMVGRSPEFWQKYYSHLQKYFPNAKKLSQKNFVRAINIVQPSLIRVEADEVSYGLHLMARFEIERDLVAGKIKVKDLPKVWERKYKELLGITPKTDSLGVLQDIHWSQGAIGYFPTYLLGSLIAAQLLYKASSQIDIHNYKELLSWLRKNIHRHGRIYSTKELLRKVTGEDLNPQYFLDYLENKFATLYNK